MKTIISESQLKKLIYESVKSVLKEENYTNTQTISIKDYPYTLNRNGITYYVNKNANGTITNIVYINPNNGKLSYVSPYFLGNINPQELQERKPLTADNAQQVFKRENDVQTPLKPGYDPNTGNELKKWNALGRINQIKAIQAAAGIPKEEQDGKIGPQTLGMIFRALGQNVYGVNGANLKNANWRYNKPGYENNPIEV